MNRQEWNIQHKACPKCGSAKIRHTLMGVTEIDGEYEDNVNTASCDCGWRGKVCDLVPASETIMPEEQPADDSRTVKIGEAETAGKQEAAEPPLQIRILDFQGKSYACIEDVVTEMLKWAKATRPHLPSVEAATFFDAITAEIAKMFVNIDKQHWLNKKAYEDSVINAEREAKKKNGEDGAMPKAGPVAGK